MMMLDSMAEGTGNNAAPCTLAFLFGVVQKQ